MAEIHEKLREALTGFGPGPGREVVPGAVGTFAEQTREWKPGSYKTLAEQQDARRVAEERALPPDAYRRLAEALGMDCPTMPEGAHEKLRAALLGAEGRRPNPAPAIIDERRGTRLDDFGVRTLV